MKLFVLFFHVALLRLLLAMLAAFPNVNSQEPICERELESTVLHPTTDATEPLVMTCVVPAANVLGAGDDFIWKWDDLAPDHSVAMQLPNTTGATCEF